MATYSLLTTQTEWRMCQTCKGTGQKQHKRGRATFTGKCTGSGCRNGRYAVHNTFETKIPDRFIPDMIKIGLIYDASTEETSPGSKATMSTLQTP